MKTFDPLEFGARGDGQHLDTGALQAAIDAAHAAGGGTVSVPAGRTLLIGHVHLRSKITLWLEPGSRLLAALTPESYPLPVLLWAKDASDVCICGPGTIDGRGTEFMVEELPHIFRFGTWRPKLIVMENCRHIRMSQWTLRHAPHYAVHLRGCDDVTIDGVSILNHLKIPNGDGIDPDCCRNVRISNCLIQAGDDCIVLKATREAAVYGPCENITVTNCTLISTSAALKLGTETVQRIRNVVFSNCVIRGSHRGLALVLRDEGSIENVLFHNITIETRLFHPDWWGGAEAVYISAHPRAIGGKIGKIRGVRFSQIQTRGEAGVLIHGSPESVIEHVSFESVWVELASISKFPPGRFDIRPPDALGCSQRPLAAVRVHHAKDIQLRNGRVTYTPELAPGGGLAAEFAEVTCDQWQERLIS
jgi:polygalacturonase